MAGFRDIKRQARADLHDELKVAAIYLVATGMLDTAGHPEYTETPVEVRVRTKWAPVGDQQGTSFHAAEKQEAIPRIVFWAAELVDTGPVRGAIVSVEAGEAYVVENVLPKDDLTWTAEVSRMRLEDTQFLPVPEIAP